MKTIILILKGILLHSTMITTVFFLIACDNLYDRGYLTIAIITVVILIYACYKTITEKEFNILSGYKLLIGIPDNEL